MCPSTATIQRLAGKRIFFIKFRLFNFSFSHSRYETGDEYNLTPHDEEEKDDGELGESGSDLDEDGEEEEEDEDGELTPTTDNSNVKRFSVGTGSSSQASSSKSSHSDSPVA